MNRKRSLPKKAAASPKLCLYLKDNTPIRTIEVSYVTTDSSEDFSEEFIRGCFECVGPVERVAFAKTTINEWLAYVTYVNPEHVAALIHNKDVTGYAQCSKFAIKIADDAHQIDPNILSLDRVNDDCLLYIMSYLTSFDAINLCNASARMQSVGQIYYRKFTKFSYRTAQQDSSINEANLPVVLEAIGDHIRSIDWRYLKAAQFDLLIRHCPYVTELKLIFPQREVKKVINQSKGFFENLKELYIASSDLFDVQIRNMLSGKKLISLEIQDCNKICGKFFTKANCVNLKSLKIVNCTNVRKKNFNLHEWKGKLTTFVSDTCCNYLLLLALPTEKLERMEELHLDISCFKGATRGLNFSGLKMLKKLSLTRSHRHQFNIIDANNMIDKLSQIDSLESLTIYRCSIDTNTIQLLRSLTNLKYLQMHGIDNKIGTNLYEQISEYLSKLRELTIQDEHVCTITGKEINVIMAGMPMLNYFLHPSISWECLDGIRQTKSSTAHDEKKPPLKIGVPSYFLNNPKKEAFEAIHKGAIKLCIRQ